MSLGFCDGHFGRTLLDLWEIDVGRRSRQQDPVAASHTQGHEDCKGACDRGHVLETVS